MTDDLNQILDKFRDEVWANGGAIDPDDDYEWDSLVFGYVLGAGGSAEMAEKAVDVWYEFVNK